MFLLALPAALFGLWIRLRTEESETFKQIQAETSGKKRSPIRQAFRENKVRMLQVVLVLSLTAIGFCSLAGYFVASVQTTGGLSRGQSLLLNAMAMTAYTVLLPLAGMIGDRVGRKPMLIAGSAAMAALTVPSFLLVTSGSFVLAGLGQLLFVMPLSHCPCRRSPCCAAARM